MTGLSSLALLLRSHYGYGNAMGVVLAVIIAILSAVQFKLGNQDN